MNLDSILCGLYFYLFCLFCIGTLEDSFILLISYMAEKKYGPTLYGEVAKLHSEVDFVSASQLFNTGLLWGIIIILEANSIQDNIS